MPPGLSDAALELEAADADTDGSSAGGLTVWESEVIDAEPVTPDLPDLRPEPVARRYDMPPLVEHCTGQAAIEAPAQARRIQQARYPQRKALPAPRSIYG